ncbi:hypothetical protein E1265_15705 [Streptomyces sp. 8K308]|uniref:hypothetical protein n=1 Tax=Streptomyces sp. 8K308 TaxID=2530388 RepID=UPI001045FED4|nr:hypothetical protein [Streptomyces sp. 8K308]TDC22433.1 hypothetical protein E1265_15705 [Streptomyces sp. 8K308]
MTEREIVPLPPDRIPSGTRDWRSADTRRWLAAGPARWSRPRWAVGALLVAGVWALAVSPGPVCSEAAPCGPEWSGALLAGLALLQLYWVRRLPGLALLTMGPTAAVCMLADSALGAADGTGRLAVLLAAGFALASAHHRRAAYHAQRRLALDAAGPARHPLPPAAAGFNRGTFSLAVGSLLLAGATLAAWQGVRGVADHEARAARATVVRAEVTRQGEDEISVALPGEEDARTVEAYAEDYPVGGEIAVLVDGDWLRLVAEPYDAAGWQFLMLLLGVPGVAFLANGLDGRRRAQSLRSAPLPTLRVLVTEDHRGRTVVYPVDDPAATRPVLSFDSLPAFDEADDEADEEADEDADDEAEPTDDAPPLHEGVLYGAPRPGGELAFLADSFGEPLLECSTSPVRAAPVAAPRSTPARPPRPRRSRRSAVAADTASVAAIEAAAARLGPGAEPRSWSAGRVSRFVGLGLLLAQLGAVSTLLSGEPAPHWLLLLGLPAVLGSSATALNWRITADRRGLWLTGAWRVRHVPWERLTAVWREGDDIRVGVRGEESMSLSFTGFSWLERRLGHQPRAERTVEEIRALRHHPELRPERDSRAADHGAPLGPVLVAAIALTAITVLLLW